MYLARIADGAAEAEASLADVRAALGTIAGGLDARFVEAGAALARAYEIVEKLVGALEGVTHALDREAADAAIAKMRMTADRLMRLPQLQANRADALATIQRTSKELRGQVAQVDRLLSFLRICGLNIKVAAAGLQDFSDFADTIFTKLDLGEDEMHDIGREVDQLAASIPGVLEIERRLAAECARVIPRVPLKLAEDALALQRHQVEAAECAARIADVARDVRTRVATALGALQIGDITRQRLEHVADGIRRLDAFLAEYPCTPAAAAAIRGHVLALLAAQAEDAAQDLARESALLAQSVRAIVPGARTLLELKDAGAADDDSSLLVVERSVAEVASVTAQLQDADARSNRLSSATSETAESLARRLRQIHRITNDVQHMAWNTDLRCHRMGQEGRALATVASEIRGFANRLEAISTAISDLFARLAGAAGSIRDPDGTGADVDDGDALADSLACIRGGGERLRAGLSGLDRDASAVADILDGTTAKVDCGEVSATLAGIVGQLAAFAFPCAEPPEEAGEPLAELLGTIARSYTMAREREVHRRFALESDAAPEPEAAPDDDDFDDGLF